jgi:hypothetical protein
MHATPGQRRLPPLVCWMLARRWGPHRPASHANCQPIPHGGGGSWPSVHPPRTACCKSTRAPCSSPCRLSRFACRPTAHTAHTAHTAQHSPHSPHSTCCVGDAEAYNSVRVRRHRHQCHARAFYLLVRRPWPAPSTLHLPAPRPPATTTLRCALHACNAVVRAQLTDELRKAGRDH